MSDEQTTITVLNRLRDAGGEDAEVQAKQIVDGEPYGRRPFELQAVGERDVFATDKEAWVYVRARAAAGNELAQKALAFLAERSPRELKAINYEALRS